MRWLDLPAQERGQVAGADAPSRLLLARPGNRQLGQQGAHRRALIGKDPDVAVPAGECERLGQRAQGAGVIAAGGQRQRPQRADLDEAAGPGWSWASRIRASTKCPDSRA